MAVAGYDARWPEVLRDAGTKEVTFLFLDLKTANNLRQKLYRLRMDMKKETHPFYPLASRVAISVVLCPKDSEPIRFINYQLLPEKYKNPPDEAGEVFLRYELLKPFLKEKKSAPVILKLRPHDLAYEDILSDAGYAIPDQPDLG